MPEHSLCQKSFNLCLRSQWRLFRECQWDKFWGVRVVSKNVVLVDVPRYQTPEQGSKRWSDGTKNPNEDTKKRNDGAKTAHPPKPPFYKTAFFFLSLFLKRLEKALNFRGCFVAFSFCNGSTQEVSQWVRLAAEKWAQTLLAQTFGTSQGSRGHPGDKVCFVGPRFQGEGTKFSGKEWAFRHPPLCVEDPHPTGRSPDPKS